MLSATCSVCSTAIDSESDRIYCFGGCDQILHIRCSELNNSGANAVRNNASLKYMCFGCRKQQTCINDITKKCSEIIERVNAVNDLVLKHDAALDRLQTDLSQRITMHGAALKLTENDLPHRTADYLLPRLLAALGASYTTNTKNVATNDNNATCSYAAVARGSETVKQGLNDVVPLSGSNENAPEEGGFLRSGRRRLRGGLVNTEAKNSLNNEPSSKQIAPQKSTAVTKFEETVSFKPRKTQNIDKTKSDIRAKIDPAPFCIKSVQYRENGEVNVRCDSKSCALNLIDTASKVMSENYEISIMEPLKPRIKIIGLSEEISADEIIEKLKKQNNLSETLNVKCVRIRKKDAKTIGAVIETDATTFEHLLKQERVNIGWDRCKVSAEINVRRCFNCSEFGHIAAHCKRMVCCPICAGEHGSKDCNADFQKCANCERINMQCSSTSEAVLNSKHAAWSTDCPVYQKRLKIVKQRFDYST